MHGGMVAQDLVEETVAPGVLRCTLNRPEHANMLTQGLMDGLRSSLTRAIDEDDIFVVVITGAGPTSFCEGVDPAEAERFFASEQAYRQFLIGVRDLYLLFGAIPKPIIAAVNGTARMGGIELALACDLIVASSAARLGDGHPGGIGGGGVSKRLPEAIGSRNARWLMYTGDLVDAAWAYQSDWSSGVPGRPVRHRRRCVGPTDRRTAHGQLAGADQGTDHARAARRGRAPRRDRPIHPALFRSRGTGRIRRVAGGRAPRGRLQPFDLRERRRRKERDGDRRLDRQQRSRHSRAHEWSGPVRRHDRAGLHLGRHHIVCRSSTTSSTPTAATSTRQTRTNRSAKSSPRCHGSPPWTTRVRIGSLVIVVPERNPFILGKQLATIDLFNGGRTILGAGMGWMKEEFDILGAPLIAATRWTESIELMRTMWREHPTSFDGEFWRSPSIGVLPHPVQPTIPVWMGGNTEQAQRRTGRIADGRCPYGLGPEDLSRGWDTIRRSAEAAGRDPAALNCGLDAERAQQRGQVGPSPGVLLQGTATGWSN